MHLQLFARASTLVIGFATLPAHAQETTTYQYDQLGRLVRSSISSGPNSTVTMATCFDAAGNRLQYFTGTSAPPTCATPAPALPRAPTITRPNAFGVPPHSPTP